MKIYEERDRKTHQIGKNVKMKRRRSGEERRGVTNKRVKKQKYEEKNKKTHQIGKNALLLVLVMVMMLMLMFFLTLLLVTPLLSSPLLLLFIFTFLPIW